MMERLGDDARRLLDDAGAGSVGALARIVDVWPGAVGEAIARVAWPKRLARDGTLHVATASSVWAFELQRLSPLLEEKLRASLSDREARSLRFAPGPVPEPPAAERAPPPATPIEKQEAASIAAAIADEELRDAVARAAAAALVRQRGDRTF
jgi:hypothetical protein